MKYSKLVFKTVKSVNKDLHSKNARLLTQAGYIHQEISGVYTFLPLGLRVLNKIEKIIREEMDEIGVETLMTSLVPVEYWRKTKRFQTVDVLMKAVPANAFAKSKNDTEYVLASTHEETVTPLAMEFNKSYKDFPFAIYQIQTKFRNEPRAKSGLLRCREFRMKDLYSFHTSEEDLKKYYEKAKQAYWNVFERLGIGKETTYLALASGGDFTPDFSHEFQTLCEAGEDVLFHVKSINLTFNREVAPSKAPAKEWDKEMHPKKDVKGVGVIGVEDLVKHLGVQPDQTIKTLIFETDTKGVVVAAVRGDYDVHEEKLKKIIGCSELHLASPEVVKKTTGAEIGYAGIINLPAGVPVYLDDAIAEMKNFETGANKTNYHTINVNFDRDIVRPAQFYDIKVAKRGDLYPVTGEEYEVLKTAEVGNIFPLNVKFSKAFEYTYIDEQGQSQPVYMGCYGIGPSRIMGVLAEKFGDEKGLVWPANVAPFQVHLISLREDEKAERIYEALEKKGIEVFYDDRDTSPGNKFADADLMGIPVRLVVSKKAGEQIEWKMRIEDTKEFLSLDDVIKRLV